MNIWPGVGQMEVQGGQSQLDGLRRAVTTLWTLISECSQEPLSVLLCLMNQMS